MGFLSLDGHRRVGGSFGGGRWGCTGEWVYLFRFDNNSIFIWKIVLIKENWLIHY